MYNFCMMSFLQCITFIMLCMESIGMDCVKSESCFVCFVALRPKSTAMVIAGRSVHLTTLFPGQA